MDYENNRLRINNVMKDIDKKRKPIHQLDISLWNAKNFYKKLCSISPRVEELNQSISTVEEEQEIIDLKLTRQALWIALIIEIGRLFDTFEKGRKKVISFKKTLTAPELIAKINSIHGQSIIGEIIQTRNTYTAHISEDKTEVVSAKEICDSNLEKLLNELDEPLRLFISTYSQTTT